ncbi:hypothetical protein D3C71_1214440 [compost metagenome]
MGKHHDHFLILAQVARRRYKHIVIIWEHISLPQFTPLTWITISKHFDSKIIDYTFKIRSGRSICRFSLCSRLYKSIQFRPSIFLPRPPVQLKLTTKGQCSRLTGTTNCRPLVGQFVHCIVQIGHNRIFQLSNRHSPHRISLYGSWRRFIKIRHITP